MPSVLTLLTRQVRSTLDAVRVVGPTVTVEHTCRVRNTGYTRPHTRTRFLPRSFSLSQHHACAPTRSTGCCRFCSPVQSCTAATDSTGVTNGPQMTQENGPKLGRASGSSTPRCAALRWRWSMPVPVRTDAQDQANLMVLSALEEERYVRSPSYGYEDHGSF